MVSICRRDISSRVGTACHVSFLTPPYLDQLLQKSLVDEPFIITQTARVIYEAQTWIGTCLETHHQCKSEIPRLPMRVIHVGSSSKHVKLFIAGGNLHKAYAALSSSWGHRCDLRLTTWTLSKYSQRSIPYGKIPKTTPDAISTDQSKSELRVCLVHCDASGKYSIGVVWLIFCEEVK